MLPSTTTCGSGSSRSLMTLNLERSELGGPDQPEVLRHRRRLDGRRELVVPPLLLGDRPDLGIQEPGAVKPLDQACASVVWLTVQLSSRLSETLC